MIADWDTNVIYFSQKLRETPEYVNVSNDISKTLSSNGTKFKFLPLTNDIWARDYMPIQISKTQFIEYRYDPDYLQGEAKGNRNLKTYPDLVCDSIGLKTIKSDIIMDGGNTVKSQNTLILTDKIVIENRHTYTKQKLINKLTETFQVNKIVLIPWFKSEIFGHSDGVLRFINNDTVLVSHYYKTDTVLLSRLRQAGIKYEFLDFKVRKRDKRNWAYINFLQTKDLILLPKFDIEEDDQVLEQISFYYSSYSSNRKILQVEMSDIVKMGGALNCITWTIQA